MISAKYESFSQMFSTFFNNSRMSSTYKPVFLRALLDIGDIAESKQYDKVVGMQWLQRKGDRLLIDLNFIAVRFSKYYWDMEYSFHLKQSQAVSDANITRLIQAEHDSDKKPPTTRDIAGKGMEEFRKSVIRRSIRPQVLGRLLNDMPDLYKKVDANTISVDEELVPFLNVHKTTLKYGLNYVLSKYLEKINHNIPRITTKVNDNPDHPNRPILNKDIQVEMKKLQEDVCFYCKQEIPRYHVDHVIPFNFIFSTDPHNCVLACQQCNCTKSNMLPTKPLFSSVLNRNRDNEFISDNKKSIYDEPRYKILYSVCAAEYNCGRFFNL